MTIKRGSGNHCLTHCRRRAARPPPDHYLDEHGGKLVFSANLKRQDTPLLNISDPFLAETVEYWSTLNYSEDNLNFPSSQIWLNSLIRIDNKPFFYKSWFHAGVKDVKDLLDVSNYNFLSYTAFITKYNIKTNYLEYYKVVSALKHFRKKCSSNQNFTTLEKATDNLFSSEKVCKTFYQILIKRKTSSPVKSQGKWLAEDLFSNVQVNWENTYQLPFLCTTETKLRVFQFKVTRPSFFWGGVSSYFEASWFLHLYFYRKSNT